MMILSSLKKYRKQIFLVYFAIVFLVLILPLPPNQLNTTLSLVAHFVMFFLMYALLEYVYLFKSDVHLLLNTVLLAMLLEFIQMVIPYRFFDWLDLAVNVSGVFVSFVVISKIKNTKIIRLIKAGSKV